MSSSSSSSDDEDEAERAQRIAMMSCVVSGADVRDIAAKPTAGQKRHAEKQKQLSGHGADQSDEPSQPRVSNGLQRETARRLDALLTRCFDVTENVWDSETLSTRRPESTLRLFKNSTALQTHHPPRAVQASRISGQSAMLGHRSAVAGATFDFAAASTGTGEHAESKAARKAAKAERKAAKKAKREADKEQRESQPGTNMITSAEEEANAERRAARKAEKRAKKMKKEKERVRHGEAEGD